MGILCCFRNESLRFRSGEYHPIDGAVLKMALRIGTPVALQEVAMCGAQVASTAIIAPLGALAVAIIFAGLDSKGILGKAMASFNAAYGLINYFSDIMSYIRVFGLMLSSALMGQVINQLAGMVLGGGGVGYVFAVLLLIFAHMFNLVMGILGVYIHDGRLQYVEFFGKFYTGDGQLFVPFGYDTRYTLLK